jgi:hypothetical protein
MWEDEFVAGMLQAFGKKRAEPDRPPVNGVPSRR